MELKYGLISRERCDEIDGWEITDPYGYGKKLSTHGNYWVNNEDESILFCQAFMPRHDDIEGNRIAYLCIIEKEYHFVDFIVNDVKEKNNNEWFFVITIVENPFTELEEKQSLSILKEVLSFFAQKHRREKTGENFVFTFYYKGEEI